VGVDGTRVCIYANGTTFFVSVGCWVCVWAARLVRHVIPVYFVDTKDIYTYLYIRSHMYIYSCGTVIRVCMKEQEFIRVVLTGDIYIYVYMQQVCGHRRHMYMCT